MTRSLILCVLLAQGPLLAAQGYDAVIVADFPRLTRPHVECHPAPRVRERERRPFFRNRTFEIGTGMGFGLSNDALAYDDFFRSPFRVLGNLGGAGGVGEFLNDPANYYVDRISISLGDVFDGFRFHFGLDVAPLSISVNVRDEWGFGLDIAHLSATGNLLLPDNVLNLRGGEELFGVGGAAFLDFGIPVFFHVHGFRVSLRPAVYVPVFHVRPGVTLAVREGRRVELDYDMRVFTPFSLEGIVGGGDAMDGLMSDPAGLVRRSLGYDISLGVEYPILPRLSVGVSFVNIPLPFLSARLDHYARFEGHMFFDSGNIDLGALLGDDGDFPGEDVMGVDISDPVFGTDAGRVIRRPFTMLVHADYRPFGTRLVSLLPSLGFSVDSTHARPVSPEGGLSARLDLANILVMIAGINYGGRRWKNSVDFALNLRLLEIGVGFSMQSPNFVRSFQGTGLGVNLGIKLGW